MYWEIEIPLIIRNLIDDFGTIDSPPVYSDARLEQLCVVSAQYILIDANLQIDYKVNVATSEIIPDPCDPATRDTRFISLISLKAACLLDQTTLRTKAAMEGIKTSLGSAALSVNGNLDGYKMIIQTGACKEYDGFVEHWDVANASSVAAVLSPFVGNKFDPRSLLRGPFRSMNGNEMFF